MLFLLILFSFPEAPSSTFLRENLLIHENITLNKISKRKLESTGSSSWEPIRIMVDWSNMDSDSKSKYEKYLNAAIKYYNNSLSVHRDQNSYEWDSSYDIYSCNYSAKDFYNKNISGDYFLLILSTYNTSVSWAAQTKICAVQDSTHQPLIAGILLNTAITTSESSEDLIQLFTHELSHALGFMSYFYPYFVKPDGTSYNNTYYVNATVRGVNVTYMATPNVISHARAAFGCDSLPGMELEVLGSDATAYSHWAGRLMYNEYMNPSIVSGQSSYSDITLALLEDSGWYKPDYSYAEKIDWGYQKGCDFHNKKCIINNQPTFAEFCTDIISESLCTFNYLGKGSCYLGEYSSPLLSGYQYFSSNVVGGLQYVDYCPLVVETTSCRLPNSTPSNYGEAYCTDCRCVQGTYTSGSVINGIHAGCHKIKCNNNSLTIFIGNSQVVCDETGKEMTVDGYQGVVTCPDIIKICSIAPCFDHCYGGKCVNGVCVDDSESSSNSVLAQSFMSTCVLLVLCGLF